MKIVIVILILNELRQKRHTADVGWGWRYSHQGKRVIVEVNDKKSDAAIHRYSYFPSQRHSELAWG